MRIVHEASLYDANCFVTLTYRDPVNCTASQKAKGFHVPEHGSLSVPVLDENGRQIESSHFQKFMKRLRKARPGARLKYFHCGEYGSVCRHGLDLDAVECPLCNVGRPHYHAILFNCEFNDLVAYGETPSGETRYTSPELENLWKYGFVDVGGVTFQSAAYTARYIMKKITGDLAEDHYKRITELGEVLTLAPEYASMSQGIGLAWYEKYKSDLWPSDEVPVPGHGVVKKVPRYYEERLKDEDEELHEEIKRLRQVFRCENADEYSSERLMAKYKVKKAQTAQLIRNL